MMSQPAGEQTVFPPNPIRDVEVRYVKVAACGVFAIATVDFEPAQTRFELAIPKDVLIDLRGFDHQDHRFMFECIDGLAEGIEEQLGARPDLVLRTRVILRRIVISPIDSNGMCFREAGRIVARTALELAGVPGSEQD